MYGCCMEPTATLRMTWSQDHNGNWQCGTWVNDRYVGMLGPMARDEKAVIESVVGAEDGRGSDR
jgi:hypothetical protein